MNKKIIDIGNIRSNLLYITNKHTNVMAMVKANAYGHGMKQVASAIKDKVKFWGVANVKEALSLRKMLSNEHTILVVGKTNNYKTLIKNNIHITIDELTELNKIIKICKNNNLTCNIHIAINTGMNRIGVKTLCSFKKFLKKINQNNFIKLSGIFTHLFDADYTKSNFYAQMCRFEKFVNLVKNKNILIHIGGSYCLNKKLPSFINMVRVGLFLYGYGNDKLKKTLKINRQVIKITSCKKGEYIGYGKTKLKMNKIIALVPFGYADGLNRNLSGRYCVIINNQRCKIIGKICMDMLMVDITNKNVKLGDKVAVFYDANLISKILKTSPYEVLTNFNKSRAKIISQH